MTLSRKSCIRICAAAFLLYLLIHYWPNISGIITLFASAAVSLLVGAVIAYVVNIPMSFYERVLFRGRKHPITRIISMLLAVASVLAIVYMVVYLVVPELYQCFVLLFQEIPPYLMRLWEHLNSVFRLEDMVLSTPLLPDMESIDIQGLASRAVALLISGVGGMMNAVKAVVSGVFSFIVALLLGLIFAVYLLLGKERIGSQFKRALAVYLPRKANQSILYVLSVTDDCFHRFLVGQFTEAIILGALCILGMKLFGFPYATMIGALIGFTALIPIAGAYIGAGVGAFMIFTVSPVKALLFILFIVVLQQLEGNIIYPRVVGSSIGLPGIWVLSAITIGGGVAGIAGMLLGVPLTAAVYRLIGADVRSREAAAKTA